MIVTSGETVLFKGDLFEVLDFLESLPNEPLPGPDLTVSDV